MPNQYENDANYLSHFQSTGPEIWEQTSGKITHFFTGAGTGGTVTGTGKFLKEKNDEIEVVAIQAQRNHLLQGLRNFEESAKPELFLRREEVVDDWYTATNDRSFQMVKQIASNENMLVGPSSGSVLASMLEKAHKNTDKDQVFVGIFADDGRKFKSLYKEQSVFTEDEFENFLKNNSFLPKLAYQ
jgi:cysteine synthase B